MVDSTFNLEGAWEETQDQARGRLGGGDEPGARDEQGCRAPAATKILVGHDESTSRTFPRPSRKLGRQFLKLPAEAFAALE
jgi:hypothetical protein